MKIHKWLMETNMDYRTLYREMKELEKIERNDYEEDKYNRLKEALDNMAEDITLGD